MKAPFRLLVQCSHATRQGARIAQVGRSDRIRTVRPVHDQPGQARKRYQ
jgi:hypothetical protein